jgi:hypothetical protein
MRTLYAYFFAFSAACSGPADPADAGDAGGDGDATVLPDAGTPPPLAPRSISFRDRDPARGAIEGVATIEAPEDETGIESYEIVALDGAGAIVASLAEIAIGAERLEFAFAPATSWPEGAISISARSTGHGRSSSLAAAIPGDNYVRYADLGNDAGIDILRSPTLVRHAASGSMYAIGCDAGYRVSMRRCGEDGCPEARSFGEENECSDADAVIAGDVLYLLVAAYRRNLLAICSLNEAGDIGECAEHDLPEGETPDLAVSEDAIYVSSADPMNTYKAVIDVCPLEGPSAESPCTRHDVSAGAPDYSGSFSTMLPHYTALYVVAQGRIYTCVLEAEGTPGECVTSASGIDTWSTPAAIGASRLYVASGQDLAICGLGVGGAAPTCETRPMGGNSAESILRTGSTLYIADYGTESSAFLQHCALAETGSVLGCESVPHTEGHPGITRSPALFAEDDQLFAYGSTQSPDATTRVASFLTCALDDDGAPGTCEYDDVGLRPLGYFSSYPRATASPTHLYVSTRLNNEAAMTSCSLAADGEVGTCTTRLVPAAVRGMTMSKSFVYRDGALYFFGDSSGSVRVIRCPLGAGGAIDGECASYDVSEGRFRDPSVARIVSDRAIVWVNDDASEYRPRLLSCGFDEAGAPECTHVLLDASIPPGQALAYGVTASDTHAYAFGRVGRERRLYSCPFDAEGALGAACTLTVVEADTNDNSGMIAGMVIADDRIHLAHVAGSYRPWLAVCELEGGIAGSCAIEDLATSEHTSVRGLAIENGRLYIPASNDAQRPVLIACDVGADGRTSGCLRHDASAGAGDGSADFTGMGFVHDPVRRALYLVTDDGAHRHRPSAYWIPTF